jgi:hypothetical protein
MGRELKQRALNVPDTVGDGRRVKQEVVATFDFDAGQGLATGDTTIGVIPANALITGGYAEVLTTFTSPTADAATIGLEAGAADLIAAVDIADVGNPWDAGVQALIPVQTAATAIKVGTSDVGLIVDVGVEAITAGKVIFVVEYTITGT